MKKSANLQDTMKLRKTFLITTLVVPAVLCGSASAVVLASTDFDGRTLGGASNSTASGLNWVVNGLADPGDITALNAAGNTQTIFNGNALVQNMFTPGINTGNGNTFWTTSVSLTAAADAVSVTDVTFNSWSINGGQNQNVNRNSDYTLTLFSPSDVVLGTVDVLDTLSGTAAGQPLVTATFPSEIALSEAGAYRLEIKGGDFAGFNETGNHTGIDNLSINGNVAAVPEPSAIMLSVLGLLTFASRRRRKA